MRNIRLLAALFFLMAPVLALAQTKTVKGVIYEEETGETLPGATVSIAGTSKGTVADLDGSFELSGVKPSDRLRFEFFGKIPQEIPVGQLSNFIVKLRNDATELEDAVVVAFGKQKKESVIGSITTIDASTLKVPSSNLTTSLAGNVAGVIAYQRSGEPGQDNADFFVRGVTTFGANTSPCI